MGLEMAETSGFSGPPPAILAGKPVPDENGTLAKGKFAELIGVSPGRVSQYITLGKIDGAALTMDGRVHVETAKAQLRERLDIVQMTGNGLDTKLKAGAPAARAPQPQPPDAPPLQPSPIVDTLEEQIKRERLETLKAQNRKLAEEEAARAGRYVDADAARQQLGRVAGQMVTVFEGSLAELATSIAAHFRLPQRDVLHLLRTEFRGIRGRASASLAQMSDTAPVLVENAAANEAEDPEGE